jgi:hypothetical protein
MDYTVLYTRRWEHSFIVKVSLGCSVLFCMKTTCENTELSIVTAVRTTVVTQNEGYVHSSVCLLLAMFYPHALGIPDERGRRALCWKILLNYLPLTQASWSGTLMTKRELYRQFIGEVYILLPLYLVCSVVYGYGLVIFIL